MSQNERVRPQSPRFVGQPLDTGGAEEFGAVRSRADRLLQAADDAIARALSNDSERFLQATRQSGGQ